MSMLPDSCYVPRLVVKGLLELAKRHQTALLSLLLMLFTLSVGTAQAQTVISGNLTNNQTWTAAQSPYLLQGDVVLDNNALLSIQSGVTVRMAEGASFTLIDPKSNNLNK